MVSDRKTSLITGANRGIGFETARQLAAKGIKVILTARHEAGGKEAAEKLRAEGGDVVFTRLDVTDVESIEKAREFVEKETGRLDILINNAGIFKCVGKTGLTADVEIARETMETNLYGPLLMCREFIPMMIRNKYGRVVNVSSGMGQLSEMGGGWPSYRISKTALNAVTRIFAEEAKGYNVLVNSVCPGWTRTELGGKDATRTPEEAADTIVWLATLPDGGPTGAFFRDRKEIDW